MKTLKVIIATVMSTLTLGGVGTGLFLYSQGYITVQEREVAHTRVVIEDGNVTENSMSKELVGIHVNFKANESTYIGK